MILTFNRSITYKIMNEFVAPKSKKQHTNLLFILHLSFNKLEVLLLLALISTTNPLFFKNYLEKCNHLFEATWDNLSPNAHDYHN